MDFRWTPKFLEGNFRGQNSMDWEFLCIIGKILKRRCLKWVRMTHLDIWNTSYGQKRGRESNWQFDFRPLKVENQPNCVACKWHATYYLKAVNKGYNFASDLILIGGLNAKLWGPKVAWVPTLAKCHLDVGHGESCESELPVVCFSTKSAPTMH
jgi:hypothetical protein